MGTNNIPSANPLTVIPSSHHNSLKEALGNDLVPRNTSGVPTNEAGDLGTSTYRFKDLKIRNIDANGNVVLTGSLSGTTASLSGNIESTGGNITAAAGDITAGGNLKAEGKILYLSSDGRDRIFLMKLTNNLNL